MPRVATRGDTATSNDVWVINPSGTPPTQPYGVSVTGTIATGCAQKTWVNSKPVALVDSGGTYLPARTDGGTSNFKVTGGSSWKVEGKQVAVAGSPCSFDSAPPQAPVLQAGTGSIDGTGSPNTRVD